MARRNVRTGQLIEVMVKKKRLILVIVMMAMVASIAYAVISRQQKSPATPAANKPAEKSAAASNQVRYAPNSPQLAYLQIAAALALPEPLIEPLNARIMYDENVTARISSPIAGRIVKLGAQAGDTVRAGQPLLWMDAPEFSSAIADQAKSQADVRQKQAVYARAKSLYEGEVLARKDMESSQADLAQSEAESRRAAQRLNNLTRGVAGDRDKFVLRAPVNGVVTERKANAGSEVRPDAPDPLFVVTDPTHLWIIIDVPEKYIGKVKVGQKVAVDADAFPGADFLGQIESIGEVLDPATRRVQVRCTIKNPQRRLKPEMFVRVTPIVDESRKLVRIPNGAIITEGLYSFVFIEKAPGLFERQRIALGLQGREESYVKDGIREGERVVGSGALLLNAELAGRN